MIHNWFRTHILWKILGGFGILAAAMILIAAGGFFAIRQADQMLKENLTRKIQPLTHLNKLQYLLSQIGFMERATTEMIDVWEVEGSYSAGTQYIQDFETELALLCKTDLLTPLQIRQLQHCWTRYKTEALRSLKASQQLNMKDARSIISFESYPRFIALVTQLDNIAHDTEREAQSDYLHTVHTLKQERWAFALISLLIITFGTVASVAFGKYLLTHIYTLERASRQLAEGQLEADIPVRSEDEFGNLALSFNSMRAQILHRERELNESREWFRSLVESTSDWIWDMDSDGRFRYSSPQVSDLLGYERQEVVGKRLFDFLAPDSTDHERQQIQQAIHTERIANLEIRCVHRNQETVILECNGIPIFNAAHQFQGFRGISHDITLRKSYETKLELLVKTRTRELEETHQKLLNTARSAGREEVAVGVLHNVGNVLNSVVVSNDILADLIKHSKATEGLQHLHALMTARDMQFEDFIRNTKEGQRLPELLSRVADIHTRETSRILSEQAELAIQIDHVRRIVGQHLTYAKHVDFQELFSIPELIESVLQICSADLLASRAQVETHISLTEKALSDREKIAQVLINLIRNACQAMLEKPDSTLRLVISADQLPDGQVQIQVTDSGIGIHAENLVKIFNYGYTTKPDGFGFGLHSAANTMTELGGHLCAQSPGPGLGATFTLTFPGKGKHV